MKIYLVGRITGLQESQYTANFEKAKQEVIALGHEPVSPIELNHDHDKEWSSYMKVCITELLKCDGIFLQKGWGLSEGAKLEEHIAHTLRMKIIYQK